MIFRNSLLVLLCAFSASACGGSKTEAAAPETPANAEANKPASEASAVDEADPQESSGPMSIPTECHKGSDPCTADPRWVRRLCSDVYPAVALYLFQSSSPFTRGYISARQVRAVNASGGVTSGEEWLEFDEEVILLHHRAPSTDGIQVSGAGDSYEAMRIDGSCVSLGGDEVRTNVPPQPKYVKIPWRYIGEDMQDYLRSLPSVKDAYIERRTECKGAFSGTVTDKCIKKDKALNRAIIEALKSSETSLPEPQKRP